MRKVAGIGEENQIRDRIKKSIHEALKQGIKTTIWLLKLTIPVSFAVLLLNYFGILDMIAGVTAPVFKLVGLPGVAAVVLITSIFTNIYSVVAVLTTLAIPEREGTILAVMCLVAHNLIIETAIQKKTGSSATRMVIVRLVGAFLIAWFLNLVLPGSFQDIALNENKNTSSFIPVLTDWSIDIFYTILKIIILVNLLMILQKLLNEFKLIDYLVRPFAPLMRLFGLSENTTFLWIVANTLGLAYGGAVMISETEDGKLSKKESDLLNHHIAVSHSQLEDPLLFVTLNYNYLILVFPRMLLALFFVWLRKLEIYFRKE
ncbi:MAG: hypothetical protein A2W90_05700 [Bacteroidetes bacterium GWF2_42_66]|nr:MAG: hypothetical protein A2W92_01085 [Bacteroidetes bacterium GWA2_42_15]OFY03539.1 MAG: hypothetical protein A2W89_18425 [Bacteroidetes bacterium GWE2_42_39]OFY45904.1 MAG: hypothetical protein A2W90_05700 [Bacteroidetes bacterium GWF2_42_66]HBL75146.1 nucleoside recognition protein [Prolixibacteraceae bacterium]HCR91613.1 nucleoside recognition protein [Prolixibacteraceae bacterium]